MLHKVIPNVSTENMGHQFGLYVFLYLYIASCVSNYFYGHTLFVRLVHF